MLNIKHGRVVLFMSSLMAASKICDEGVWLSDMFFGASPYSFTPRMFCNTCGQLGHKSCEVVKYFEFGALDHIGSGCPSDQKSSEPFCVHCKSQGHFPHTCPVFNENVFPL